MEILIFICVALSVYLVSSRFITPKEVSVTEEWRLQHGESKQKRIFYLIVCCLISGFAGYAVTGTLKFALLAVPAGYFLEKMLAERSRKAKRKLLRTQYAQALNILTSAMQGGLSPYQALEDAVPSMPRPAKDVFIEILRRSRTGGRLPETVKTVSEETGWNDLNTMAIAFKLYEATGCNLVEVFKHLLESVYERESDRKYTEAVTAQIRTTATILSGLPFVIMGFTRMASPDFSHVLFDTTGGNVIVILCVVMVLIGNQIVKGMVNKLVGSD